MKASKLATKIIQGDTYLYNKHFPNFIKIAKEIKSFWLRQQFINCVFKGPEKHIKLYLTWWMYYILKGIITSKPKDNQDIIHEIKICNEHMHGTFFTTEEILELAEDQFEYALEWVMKKRKVSEKKRSMLTFEYIKTIMSVVLHLMYFKQD